MKSLILLSAMLISLSVMADTPELLNTFNHSFKVEENTTTVELTYNLPCGFSQDDVKEIKYSTQDKGTLYVGLALKNKDHIDTRVIYCVMAFMPVIHVFKVNNENSPIIEILN